MPGISKYLKKLCSSDGDALTLHRALDKQLDELAAATEAKKVPVLDDLLSALDKVAGLCKFAQRSRQDLLCAPAACPCPCAWMFNITATPDLTELGCRHGVLFEPVGVQEVLINLCVALHEENIAYTGKVRIYKAMVALIPSTAATTTVRIQRCFVAEVSIRHTTDCTCHWGI